GDITLRIRVPFLGYSVAASRVQESESPRLRLHFQTRGGVAYEARFRATLQAAWTPVQFSLTAAGPADQSVLIGTDLEEAVYVDRVTPTGFFSIAIQVLDLSVI